jgi:transposase
VSGARVWRALVGVEHAVVERVEYDQDEQAIVVHVRAGRRQRGRCGICRRRCRGYDQGDGRRRWRHLDAGTLRVWLEADAPRVQCREHGVAVAFVPWARHGAGPLDRSVSTHLEVLLTSGLQPGAAGPPQASTLDQIG